MDFPISPFVKLTLRKFSVKWGVMLTRCGLIGSAFDLLNKANGKKHKNIILLLEKESSIFKAAKLERMSMCKGFGTKRENQGL